MAIYDIGDMVRLFTEGPFRDDGGNPVDPDVVLCKIRDPARVKTTFQYGVDSDVVRDGVGLYHVDLVLNLSGTWYYRWQSTGNLVTAEETSFIVRLSVF